MTEARDVARVVCLGPALVAAADKLGGPKLSALLSRTVRLAFAACEGRTARLAESFASAVERLRKASDAPITLQLLCSAVCAPRALEVAEAALEMAEAELRGKVLTTRKDLAACFHGAGCDCGGVMGGGFL